MSNADLSMEEISEILEFIRRIKVYEEYNTLRVESVNLFIWGALLFVAGISDYFLSFLTGYSPNFVPWVINVFLAGVLGLFEEKSLLPMKINEERNAKRQSKAYTLIFFIILFLMFIPTILLGMVGLFYLVMPVVGIELAGLMLYFHVTSKRTTKKKTSRVSLYIVIAVSSIITTIINLGLYVLNPELNRVQGLIFGTGTGFVFLLNSFMIRNRASKLLVNDTGARGSAVE